MHLNDFCANTPIPNFILMTFLTAFKALLRLMFFFLASTLVTCPSKWLLSMILTKLGITS
jgi:hypothetical protein